MPPHTDWLLYLFLISAFLVVFARLYHPRKFSFFISLPFNVAGKDFEEGFNPNGVKDVFDILLTLNSYMVFSIGCYLIVEPVGGPFFIFIRILFVLIVFFLTKNLLELFVGWLFYKHEVVAITQNTALAYRSWTAVILLPLIFILAYIPQLEFLITETLAIAMILAYVLAFVVSSFRSWNYLGKTYYKILYLCALELTPFFILVNWLKSLIE